MEAYIYLIQPEPVKMVYKVGKSRNITQRMKNYPENLIQIKRWKVSYFELDDIERAIIKLFKSKYKLVDGYEYFEAPVDNLVQDIDTLINNYIEPEKGICEPCARGFITLGKSGTKKFRCTRCYKTFTS